MHDTILLKHSQWRVVLNEFNEQAQNHTIWQHYYTWVNFKASYLDERIHFYAYGQGQIQLDRQYFLIIRIKILDLFLSEFFILLFHFRIDLIEIIIKVLEDHIELISNKEYLFKFNNISMIEFSKGFNLSELNTLIPIIIFLFHFFDGNNLISFSIHSFIYSTKSTIT